ncbi:hypothetical protein D7B12_17885 [Salmonella enterica]|nr:hypothetical protein [Salmonella enterica]
MAAIIELTNQERRKLIKLLNNLNLGFVFSGFGEAFVAMLDGAPVTFEDKKRHDLVHLINNLNLGFAQLKAGDLLVGLMDAATQKATAQAMTDQQTRTLKHLVTNLNMGFAHTAIGSYIQAAINGLNVRIPPAKITAAGQVQYSKDAATWTDTITDVLKVATPVDFFIRVNPSSLVAPDDGTYQYNFLMTGQPDGSGGNTAGIGGLSLINDATTPDKAHITGQVPADQVGKLFSVNVTVKDAYGTAVTGKALSKAWTA